MSELVFMDDDEDDAPRRGRRVGGEAPGSTPESTRSVVVCAPVQVVDDAGKVYLPGDVATVPESLAELWLHCQWVEEANSAEN